MDFASALKDLEQTADAAAARAGGGGGGRGGGSVGGYGGGTGGRDGRGRGGRGRSGVRGTGGGSDYHYQQQQEGRSSGGRGGGRGYPPGSSSSISSSSSRGGERDFSRGEGRSSYYDRQHQHQQQRQRGPPSDRYEGGGGGDRRHQPRPRLEGGRGEYGARGEYGGGRGSSGRGEYGGSRGGDYGGRGRARGSPQGRSHRPQPLEEMREYGYHIDPYRPPAELPEDLGKRPFHICVLAIVINSLPYEHIWRHWATTTSQATNTNVQVSLLVHAKYPDQVESTFVKRRLITKPPQLGRGNSFADPEYLSHQPAWGSVQITRAMVDLLRVGLVMGTAPDLEMNDARFSAERFLISAPLDNYKTDIRPADKFLFVSETCLPVQTLAEFERAFFGSPDLYQNIRQQQEAKRKDVGGSGGDSGEDKSSRRATTPWELSWVNARNRATPGTPKNKYEGDQFASIHRMLHGSYRWKADQWLCLSRLHAAAVMNVDAHKENPYCQLWSKCFRDVNASDEMYFPSLLAVLQILTPPEREGVQVSSNGQVVLRPVTYTDWSEGMRNPATFSKGIANLNKIAPLARQQQSLVARKFALQAPPGNPKAPITGEISVEEWTKVVEACRKNQEEEEEEENSSQQEEKRKQQAAAEEAAGDSSGNEGDKKKNGASYDQENENVKNEGTAAAAATNEDDDDDEEEDSKLVVKEEEE